MSLPRSMSLPAALADAPSSSGVAEPSSSYSKYTPEQAAAAKAARRASMLDYAKRVRRDEHDYAYADGRAAAVRFLSPLPTASSRSHSSSSLSLTSLSASASSSSLSPRKEGEDAFNLGGFFPSRPGSPGHAVSSAWLEDEEGEVVPAPLPAREEFEERRFGGGGRLPPKKSLSMSALDDYAKNVIASEGQVGILSFVPSFLSKLTISTPMLSKETIDEDEEYDGVRTPSTMSIDEPFDAESLLASHTDRRNSASFSPLQLQTAIPPANISLFSPTKEADDPIQLQHLSLGWADSLYSRLIAPVL
ncbi:hypothetical protein SCHPADRAFT_931215 [Schizopora paradoxa]|uniref:Uncharacterized protein n=1 Tax=Schizopora paradoxa TaxID=27342 RepID=A0A0H2RCU6_9AGAM|nr:hypothetical protein SCHPADRAFT_931215 [Schizopora paradoxa]